MSNEKNNNGIYVKKIAEGNTLTLKFCFGGRGDRQDIEQKIEGNLIHGNETELYDMRGSYKFYYKRGSFCLEVKLLHTEFVSKTKTQEEIEQLVVDYTVDYFSVKDFDVNREEK